MSSHSGEIDDPVETMIKVTGCLDYHYKVQECIAESNDWRKCQPEVKEFKQCMQDYNTKQKEKYAKK